jgi:hypothetical protein
LVQTTIYGGQNGYYLTGIQVVKTDRSHIQMIDSLEAGILIPDHLNTGFQFVWYSNGSGIQKFFIQIPTVLNQPFFNIIHHSLL